MVNGSRIATPTFIKIDGSVRKLGELKPVSLKTGASFTKGNFSILFYKGGAQRLVKEDAWFLDTYKGIESETIGEKKVRFCWKPAAQRWCLYDDWTSINYPVDDYPITPEDGFLMKVGNAHGEISQLPNAGVQLTYSGAVDPLASPVVAVNTSIVTGNMTPIVRTLKELQPVSLKTGASFTKGNFSIQFYDNGAQRLVKNDPWFLAKYEGIESEAIGEKKVRFCWKPAANKWCLYDDWTSINYSVDDYPIEPGDGFLMKVGNAHGEISQLPNAGVKLQFPSALK